MKRIIITIHCGYDRDLNGCSTGTFSKLSRKLKKNI